MPLALVPGVSCCDCNGIAILLDVNRDRYFALAPNSGDALLRLARGDAPGADDRGALDGITARGVLRYEATLSDRPLLATGLPIDRSVLDADDRTRPFHLAALGRSAVALGRASLAMRWRSLASRLAAVAGRPVAGFDPASRDGFADHARQFEAARRLLPFDRSCLRDSLALLHFLRPLPTRPQIVFGVRTDPFRAHCWVQHGDVLLNEVADMAALFTPILVV